MAVKRPQHEVRDTRTVLAYGVVVLGFAGIVAISWVALDKAADKAVTSAMIFSSVLPLIGTWVGAILAFYFASHNLQAASRATLDAVQAMQTPVTADTSVTKIMTPVYQIQPREQVADKAAAGALVLRDMYAKMT